jgi:hypothetical protein
VLEFSLPGLQRRRQHFTAQLAPAGAGDFGDPEGLACGNGHLYLAWARWEQVCMTGVPLQRLEQLQKPTGRDGSATITGCAAPEGEPWMLWGTCVGPDGALYAAANPEYAACPYTETPTELGRGRVLRAPVNSDGSLTGELRVFCGGGRLSRPSGLCFDGAGDLFVTNMDGQVLRFAGPGSPQPGRFLGLFADTSSPHHLVRLRQLGGSDGAARLRPRHAAPQARPGAAGHGSWLNHACFTRVPLAASAPLIPALPQRSGSGTPPSPWTSAGTRASSSSPPTQAATHPGTAAACLCGTRRAASSACTPWPPTATQTGWLCSHWRVQRHERLCGRQRTLS